MNFFENIFEVDEKKEISGLTNELKSIYIYNLYKKTNRSIICVLNTIYEANQLYQRLQSYTDEVLFFPMDDFLTSEALAISPELKITRLETINSIIKNSNKIIVTNIMGYLRYLPTKDNYIDNIINLKVNDEIEIKELLEKLYKIGYDREILVNKTGDMAVRGFIIDIFPINESNPIRLEFFGDTIEDIRIFDIESQLTIKKVKDIKIYPNTEDLINEVKDSFKHRDLPIYIETGNINDYCNNPIIVFNNYNEIINSYTELLEDIIDYNKSINIDEKTKYMNDFNNLLNYDIKYLNSFDNNCVNDTKTYISYELDVFPKEIDKIKKILLDYIKNKKTVIICVKDQYKINKILDVIEDSDIVVTNENEIFNNKINIIKKDIKSGFIYNKYIVISEREMFNSKSSNYTYKSNFKYGSKVRDINKLNIGDYIVHNIHGIGRYLGIKTLIKNGLKKDYITIEYKGGDKLYIPVEKIDLISKYSANDSLIPKINKLGGTEWTKTKLKIKRKLENIAGELLKLYAIRESTEGFSFIKDGADQISFEKDFAYEDTIDQIKVTEEIKKDMEKNRPMDRLVCGDVGYGKTEIAFRAMFKAVMSNKQVAYLCPTTILSNQHYNNALERFKNFPVNIACLNRFTPKKEVSKILEGLQNGVIDIVIGTHRILSDDVVFKDIGLLVIDEEQRFGVKHKEKIKTMKNNIDVLTLSATPIPRTLQMSMVGIRNLSLLETPPVNRYPVQTYVLEENDHIIKEAIYRELARDGQVFILYNHVGDMDIELEKIKRLVPEVRIVSANGQMDKNKLEDVMMKFINKEYDVLICTTIIETGIDIPNVNTLLIIDADRFGLSQLYQIRGRVGRTNKIAYCYLMYKKGKVLTDVATKRLNVIREFTELGSGFSIAARDLSIRGAGDILGSEQAGFIDSVGIDLYLKMLNEEINRQRGIIEEQQNEKEQPLLDVETAIDDSYVEETDLKIFIHKRINEIDSYEKLSEVKSELEDRFGNINENMLIYMYEEWFEKLALKLNINKIRQTKNFIEIVLSKELTEKINGEYLFMELVSLGKMFRFKKQFNSLIVILDTIKLDKHFIYYLIDFLNILEKSIKK